MGQALRKFCADDDATNEAPCVHELKRAETLMAGQEVQQQFRFSKSAILLKLNEDQTQFTWRTLRSSKSDKLRVADLRSVEARGARGLCFVGDGEMSIVFPSERTRDAWITAANELLTRRDRKRAERQQQEAASPPTSPDQDRWQRRHDELEQRREGRSSLRTKYAEAGTTHTDSAKKRRAERKAA